jgi:ABC-type amino acid transport substrate-binding protein
MKRLLICYVFLLLPFTHISALTIGVMPNYPPLSSLTDQKNHFSGFEIDLMQGICQRIKLPCKFTAVIMKQIQPDLIAQKIDLAIASYIIPDKPLPGFIFSLPYLESNAEFIVNQDSEIFTPADLEHKTIGVRHGTMFDELLAKLYGNKVSITKYMSVDELISALNNRDIDAALTDAVAADRWMINSAGQYRIVGKKIPIGNGYGILANVGQETLMAQINHALQTMMIDGSYVKIYSAYFG